MRITEDEKGEERTKERKEKLQISKKKKKIKLINGVDCNH